MGDESRDGRAIVAAQAALDDATRLAWQAGRLQLLGETELWTQLGLVDAGPGVQRFYTPAMLAELVGVPVRAVRHWHRQGHLAAERMVGRLAYFSFEQVRVAQRLAELLAAGCSLSQIDRKLGELARLQGGSLQPLADTAVVVVGRRLYVRRGEQLTEPSGQLLLDFDAPRQSPADAASRCRDDDSDFCSSSAVRAARAPVSMRPTISGRWPTISSRAARRIGRSKSIVRS